MPQRGAHSRLVRESLAQSLEIPMHCPHRILALALSMSLSVAPCICLAQAKSAKAQTMRTAISPATRFAQYGHNGAWLLKYESSAPQIVHGAALANESQAPMSTFKVLLALIALDIGELRSAEEVVTWDGRPYPKRPEWQADMALRQAMRTSSEPYFRTLAARIGRDRLVAWVQRLAYGNAQMGADPRRAWIDGVLRITPEQQLDFIDRLRRGDLPFDQATMAAVKAVMLESEVNGRRVYGKSGTGAAQGETPGVGWWIGWVEGGRLPSTSFALQVELKTADDRKQRIKLAQHLLQDAGVLPAQ
jgi:beta-lactamase class D